MLREIDTKLQRDSPLFEGLYMAELALQFIFTKGLQAELKVMEQSLTKGGKPPLTEEEVARLHAEIVRLKRLSNDREV